MQRCRLTRAYTCCRFARCACCSAQVKPKTVMRINRDNHGVEKADHPGSINVGQARDSKNTWKGGPLSNGLNQALHRGAGLAITGDGPPDNNVVGAGRKRVMGSGNTLLIVQRLIGHADSRCDDLETGNR